MSQPLSESLRRLARAARAAGRRQRLNLALERLARWLPVPLVYAALALGVLKWLSPSERTLLLLQIGFGVALIVPVLSAALAFWSRRSRHAGALALDRHQQSADRITNALEFAAMPDAERSPFMDAAIADALSIAAQPSPRRAVPFEAPRGWWVSLLLAVMVAAVAQLPRRAREVPVAPAVLAPIEPVALGADDLELLRESAEVFRDSASSPELTAAVARFNQLVEDIAERRIDRRELFARLADIERSLSVGDEADAALDEGLRDIASELEKSPLSRPVAEALKQQRLPDAEEALRELAEKLEQAKKREPAELERLRQALDAAATQSAGRLQRLEDARRAIESERRRLLSKKGAKDAASPEQKAELDRQQRRLERLDRDIADAQRAKQELSALDRELAKAAQELMKEMGESAKHMKAGAEDINRMARQKMSEQEKRDLKRQLEELREMLRQAGPGKEEHLKRLQKFAERARGQKGGKPGSGEKPGEGQAGKGQQRLMLGPGGRPIPVPMPGAGAGQPSGDGPGGDQNTSSGQEPGSQSDDALKGPPTDLDAKMEDVTAAAIDTGQGVASSEVVFSAAERGFSGSRYQKVYTQYRTVAEDVLEQDTIPAGYEFYVRRYFQLIRPRDGE
jgi:hypothetical protein